MGFDAVHPDGFEVIQPVLAGLDDVHSAGFETGQYHSPVINQASMFQTRPTGFEMGWVLNQALTYLQNICLKIFCTKEFCTDRAYKNLFCGVCYSSEQFKQRELLRNE